VGAVSQTGMTAVGAGLWSDTAGTHTVVVDSLALSIADSRWRLTAPARLTLDSTEMRIDSLLLRNRDSGVVALAASIPKIGAASAWLRAAAVPLADVGRVAQLSDTLYGVGALTLMATGTKSHPEIAANTS